MKISLLFLDKGLVTTCSKTESGLQTHTGSKEIASPHAYTKAFLNLKKSQSALFSPGKRVNNPFCVDLSLSVDMQQT